MKFGQLKIRPEYAKNQNRLHQNPISVPKSLPQRSVSQNKSLGTIIRRKTFAILRGEIPHK